MLQPNMNFMVVGCELNEVLCVRCGGRGVGEEQNYKPDSVPGPVLVALGASTPFSWGIPGILVVVLSFTD